MSGGAPPPRRRPRRSPAGLLVTDLDGTLLDSGHRLRPGEREALEALGRHGVLRVVATGRSLRSAASVLAPDVPLDYLVAGSGTATRGWPDGPLLDTRSMAPADVERAVAALVEAGLDFMVHAAAPDHHRFAYRASGRPNPDFERRLLRYAEHAVRWEPGRGPEPVSQIVAIEPPAARSRYARLARALAPLNVVRTTSPLDHASTWIEVFAPGVSKASAAERLRRRHGVAPEAVLALGNDYNDRDLLEWAPRALVVANAPADLRARYRSVASNDAGGFSEAAALLLASLAGA